MSKNKLKMYLLGNNIQNSLSPTLYNRYFSSNNIEIEYNLFDTNNISSFKNIIKSKDTFAFNVTMPYKSEILKYIDIFDESVKKSMSCNLVIKNNNQLIGYNTDGIGFFESLLSKNISVKNKKLTIIGNGCAAKSIKSICDNYEVLNTYLITHEMSNILFQNKNVLMYNDILKNIINSNIVVNASNVGYMNENSTPLPIYFLNDLTSEQCNFTFVDIIYNPRETYLVKYFKKKNFKNVYNGEGMLYYQFLENIKILKKTTY